MKKLSKALSVVLGMVLGLGFFPVRREQHYQTQLCTWSQSQVPLSTAK